MRTGSSARDGGNLKITFVSVNSEGLPRVLVELLKWDTPLMQYNFFLQVFPQLRFFSDTLNAEMP